MICKAMDLLYTHGNNDTCDCVGAILGTIILFWIIVGSIFGVKMVIQHWKANTH